MRRIGIDIGGTFTDLILADDVSGEVVVFKVPSTPHDLSAGPLEGARALCTQAGVDPSSVDQLLHGTTIATNTILEGNGAELGLITTEGFRDILHIARHRRPLTFSAYQDLPWQTRPLVKRSNRMTVPERVTAPDGEVAIPLDEQAVRQAAVALRDADVDAIAVCFLFSFLNSAHERRVREIIAEEWPSVYVVLRSEIAPQFREYEAFSTTCLSAYVGPRVSEYVARMQTTLRAAGFTTDLHMMNSAGGVSTVPGVMAQPANLIMSGPVAGLIGGVWAGTVAGFKSFITLDVGGTSADIGVAPDGMRRVRHLLERIAGGYHLSTPMLDLDAIGAGGGSIAYVDSGRMLQVGPVSAGADPGPACYGRGGTAPTVTDALVVLGRLRPEGFLGGQMAIKPELAAQAVDDIAGELGMDLENAALGIVQVLTYSMIQAIELSSTQKGYDPRDFTLVAMGGAGPAFCCDIAADMNIPDIVIPPNPGITSALGLLAADSLYDFVATAMQALDPFDSSRLDGLFLRLETRALERLREDRVPTDQIELRRTVECRYVGQGYELRVQAPDGPIDASWGAALAEAFGAAHERTYARRFEGEIQIVNIHVEAVGRSPGLSYPKPTASGASAGDALLATLDAVFLVGGVAERLPTRVYTREGLGAGVAVSGPAIIEQFDSTTVVPPGFTGRVDGHGNLVLRRSAQS